MHIMQCETEKTEDPYDLYALQDSRINEPRDVKGVGTWMIRQKDIIMSVKVGFGAQCTGV